MASITNLQGTDIISTADSMATINTNITNLNNDKIETSYLDTDTAMAANSDTKIPSQKAVKTYIDTQGGANASTTVRGIVEEATAAEIDALTQTGSTGADLFINPKLLGDAKNIPHAAPGTSGNVLTSDGTDWVSSSPTLPMFQQDIVIGNESLTGPEFGAGSMTDGSALFVWVNNGGNLYRFERDSVTGVYQHTHDIGPSSTAQNGDNCAIVNVGDYIYVFANDNTNIKCDRYLAADLTGATSMTVPTVACTSHVGAWTNGTDIYVVSNSSQTTSRRWTISGTTLSTASTTTIDSSKFEEIQNSSMWDGTNAFMARINQGLVYKLTTVDASTYTTTTGYENEDFSDVVYGSIIANISDTAMYIGVLYPRYDEAGQIKCMIRLIPVSKP